MGKNRTNGKNPVSETLSVDGKSLVVIPFQICLVRTIVGSITRTYV